MKLLPQPAETPKKKPVKKLEQLLTNYSLWDKWTLSKRCFLSEKEIQVIECFLYGQDHNATALLLNLTYFKVTDIYYRARRKLMLYHRHYSDWVADRILKQAGIEMYQSDQDAFLNSPLHVHPLTSRTLNVLRGAGFDTLKEVLQCTGGELLQFRGFGKVALNELRELLEKNACSHLFR